MFRLQLTEQEIAVRNQMVNQFFMVLSIIGVLLLMVSLYRANQIGWQPIMTVHVLSVISLITITFFKKRLPYLFKAWFAVLLLLFIGLNGFLALGLLTGGHAFILVALTATVSLNWPAGCFTTRNCHSGAIGIHCEFPSRRWSRDVGG